MSDFRYARNEIVEGKCRDRVACVYTVVSTNRTHVHFAALGRGAGRTGEWGAAGRALRVQPDGRACRERSLIHTQRLELSPRSGAGSERDD